MDWKTLFCSLLFLASPLVSGGHRNGRIAFIKGADLYTIAPDGSDLQQLTRLGENTFAELPSWEPDNDCILYTVGFPDIPRQLWIIDANGRKPHRLLDDPAHGNTSGAFSSDGRIVIFSRCDKGGACGIYQVRIDGQGLTAVTAIQPGVVDSFPVYSLNGRTIAFARQESNGSSSILLMDRDGSSIRPLTRSGISARHPSWSLDGSSIMFSGTCDASGRLGIWLIDPDGGGLTRLAETPALASGSTGLDHLFPSLSPDGNFLAVEQRAAGVASSIVVVDLVAAGPHHQRFSQLIAGGQPSWSQAP